MHSTLTPLHTNQTSPLQVLQGLNGINPLQLPHYNPKSLPTPRTSLHHSHRFHGTHCSCNNLLLLLKDIELNTPNLGWYLLSDPGGLVLRAMQYSSQHQKQHSLTPRTERLCCTCTGPFLEGVAQRTHGKTGNNSQVIQRHNALSSPSSSHF